MLKLFKHDKDALAKRTGELHANDLLAPQVTASFACDRLVSIHTCGGRIQSNGGIAFAENSNRLATIASRTLFFRFFGRLEPEH